jgi:hypothetical protein
MSMNTQRGRVTVEEILGRYLGVTPRMRVTGVPVAPEQAREIIRRTDRLLGSLSCNDYPYLVRVARALRLPLWEQYLRELRANPGYVDYEAQLDALRPAGGSAYYEALSGEHYEAYLAAHARWDADHARWLEDWGFIATEEVGNDWLSAQSAYGPRGWCHPDGTIGWIDPLSKHADAGEVHADWQRLAQAFPFLNLGVTLLREGVHEGEEDVPLVGLLVRDGVVQVVDPAGLDVHAGHAPPTRGGPSGTYAGDRGVQADQDNLATLLIVARIFGPADASPVIPWEWIDEWALRAPRLED